MTKSGEDPTLSVSPSIVDHLAEIDHSVSEGTHAPSHREKNSSKRAGHDGQDASDLMLQKDQAAPKKVRRFLQPISDKSVHADPVDAVDLWDGEAPTASRDDARNVNTIIDADDARINRAPYLEQAGSINAHQRGVSEVAASIDAWPPSTLASTQTALQITTDAIATPSDQDQMTGGPDEPVASSDELGRPFVNGEPQAKSSHAPGSAGNLGKRQKTRLGQHTNQKPARSSVKERGANKNSRLANGSHSGTAPLYAALDLGTNNCRLLIATPAESGFHIIDSFSRIVRLGEGITAQNKLSDDASARAIEALRVCWNKLVFHGIKKARLIATEACRAADNGPAFLEQVRSEIGLELEVIDRETEARLAVTGCVSLIDPRSDGVVLFDIGGGSSEVVWVDRRGRRKRNALGGTLRAWDSLPLGVVTLSERHNGRHVTRDSFEAMVAEVQSHLAAFPKREELLKALQRGRHHLLGTSGTVTTLAGIQLGLRRYDRRKVDGLWMSDEDAAHMIDTLLAMDYQARVAHPCIGADRADLVLPGCAIFEAIRRDFQCSRLRVADRGLREGILVELMGRDGHRVRRGGSKGKRQHTRGSTPGPNGPARSDRVAAGGKKRP